MKSSQSLILNSSYSPIPRNFVLLWNLKIMAAPKIVFASFMLLLIIFSEAAHARRLKSLREVRTNGKLFQAKNQNLDVNTIFNEIEAANVSPPPAPTTLPLPPPLVSTVPPALPHSLDDFRPTAPGHSPGVGHNIHN